jgi:hypothetical protein
MESRLRSSFNWIQGQKNILDQVIADAARSYFDLIRGRPNGLYDFRAANEESYQLSRGKDLCYDRPSIGLVYGLWYHARRVNTSLSLVLRAILEARGQAVQVFDLGAGTGAFMWALALGAQSMREQGVEPPKLRVINVDTSPFMLHYLEHLWEELSKHYQICSEIKYECRLNTWHEAKNPLPDTWLCASYLFDHEDKKEDLSRDFESIIEQMKPQRVFLSTSAQAKKRAFMNSIGERLQQREFVRQPLVNDNFFDGSLLKVDELRSHYRNRYKIYTLRPAAEWKEHSFTGYAYAEKHAELGFDGVRSSPEEIELFTPHITDRTKVILSEEQEKAARPDDRPTVIFGPAGCGKSIVITERVKNVVEAHDYSRELRILITTFNKQLQKKVLRPWLEALLDDDRYLSVDKKGDSAEACSDFFFYKEGGVDTRYDSPNIRLMHFDVLPTRIGEVHKGRYETRDVIEDETEVCQRAVDRVKKVLEARGKNLSRFEHVLDPEYVWDEFHRVYYGRMETKEEQYMQCARPGRPRLDRDKAPRQVLWQCLEAVNDICEEKKIEFFTHRRLRFHRFLRRNSKKKNQFTHLFVDEVQDCTRSDFGIFYRLLDDPNQLVVAGDLAQAVHLGRTAFSNIPRHTSDEQRYRNFHELQGSYRLPFRISEALKPLSARIQLKRDAVKDRIKVQLQNPYRGSPPGARPIFVWAPDEGVMARKVKTIREAYDSSLGSVGFDLETCSILEKDVKLRKALYGRGVDAETNTILRLKGLEKTCLLWSTRASTNDKEEAEEIAYTILTRGARLLIVALFPDISDEFKPIVDTFERERIILWDQETERHFRECRIDSPVIGDYEEHEDPEMEADFA